MKILSSLFEEVSENDQEYYMSEGCTYFALALNEVLDYEIILLKDRARMWDDNFQMIPHVFCNDDYLQPVDVKGKRSFQEVLGDFPEVEDPRTEEITSTRLVDKYMGSNKPFFDYDSEEVERAKRIIQTYKKLFN